MQQAAALDRSKLAPLMQRFDTFAFVGGVPA
jgi:hypothetical protein